MSCEFKREERLKSEVDISKLFRDGGKGFVYPFKFLVLKSSSNKSKILISVPKRTHKHAVDRNRVKRLVRESYRQNKSVIMCEGLNIGLIYIAKEILEYCVIEKAIKTIVNQCKSEYKTLI